jgi:putative cell wall-binding protein
MEAAGVTDVILLGGEAALSVTSAAAVKAAGFASVRIDGADRFETAVSVAEFGVSDAGLGWDGVAIATGEDYPDALSGGPLQGMSGSVMLLVRQDSAPGIVTGALTANKAAISEVRFFGGLPAVSGIARAEVAAALE